MAEAEVVKLTRGFRKPGQTNEQTVAEVFNGEMESLTVEAMSFAPAIV